MSNKPTRPRHTGSETGMMRRVDGEPEVAHEPPQPPTLPELEDDTSGITGTIPLYAEGEDEAKHADDSATEDQRPRQQHSRRR
jgi:hypothetical protein